MSCLFNAVWCGLLGEGSIAGGLPVANVWTHKGLCAGATQARFSAVSVVVVARPELQVRASDPEVRRLAMDRRLRDRRRSTVLPR